MLCPNCLRNVDAFESQTGVAGNIGLTCPLCGEEVPLRYAREYAEFPPVMFSVIGFRGHGKTVFLSSFLHQLEEAELNWRDFSAAPLDETGLRDIRKRQQELETGQLPDSTRKAFIKPAIIRLQNVPNLGNCHLLLYDTAGEAIENVTELSQHYGYISRVPVIVVLVSLKDLTRPNELVDFLTVYNQTALGLEGNPKDQSLLVVLTQADKFVDEPGVPDTLRNFLRNEDDMNATKERMEAISESIKAWLSSQRGYLTFVRRAEADFKRVKFCILSATGSEPDGRRLLVNATPRGVMAPMLWVMRLSGATANKKFPWNWLDPAKIAALGLPKLSAAFLGVALVLFFSFKAMLAPGSAPAAPNMTGGTTTIDRRRAEPEVANTSGKRSSVSGNIQAVQPPRNRMPLVSMPTQEAERARSIKNAVVQEMLQIRRLTEKNLLTQSQLYDEDHKIVNALRIALYHAQKALNENPRHEMALTQKASVLFLMGNLNEAKTTANQGLQLYPDNADLRDVKTKIASVEARLQASGANT